MGLIRARLLRSSACASEVGCEVRTSFRGGAAGTAGAAAEGTRGRQRVRAATAHRSRGHGSTRAILLAHGAGPLAGAAGAGVWRQGLRQGGRRATWASSSSSSQARRCARDEARIAVRAGRAHRSRGRVASQRPRRRGKGSGSVWQAAAQEARRSVLVWEEAAATGKGHGGDRVAAASGSGGLGGGPNDGVQGFGSQAA